MKKIIAVLLSCMMCISLTACGSSDAGRTDTEAEVQKGNGTEKSVTDNSGTDTEAPQDAAAENSGDKGTGQGSKTLVAYFSLAGEQYEVGVIKKGNTQIVAEMIAEQTAADTFQIEPVKEYPDTYNGLLEVSKEESEDNPPEIASQVENMDAYQTVYIGYPIWWGDMPAIVTGFLKSYDFSSKKVIPFCTHAGSGLSGTEQKVQELCSGADIIDGLAIRGQTAQESADEAEKEVSEWLKGAGLVE